MVETGYLFPYSDMVVKYTYKELIDNKDLNFVYHFMTNPKNHLFKVLLDRKVSPLNPHPTYDIILSYFVQLNRENEHFFSMGLDRFKLQEFILGSNANLYFTHPVQ